MLFTLLSTAFAQGQTEPRICTKKEEAFAQGCCIYEFHSDYTRQQLAEPGTPLFDHIGKCNPQVSDDFFPKGMAGFLPCDKRTDLIFKGHLDIVNICALPLPVLKWKAEMKQKLEAAVNQSKALIAKLESQGRELLEKKGVSQDEINKLKQSIDTQIKKAQDKLKADLKLLETLKNQIVPKPKST